MGLLLDQSYWANVSNEMWKHRPMRTEPMPAEAARGIMAICCKSLTDLLGDPEFAGDLDRAKALTSKEDIAFQSYLGEFARAEVAIAIQAGVDAGPALAMGGYARKMAQLLSDEPVTPFDQEQFAALVEFSQKIACEGASDLKYALDEVQNQPGWRRCWQATKGVSMTAINVGVPAGIAIIEPFSGATIGWLIGRSTKCGERLLKEAWRGAW